MDKWKSLLKDFVVRQNTSSVHHRDVELVLGIHPSRGEFTHHINLEGGTVPNFSHSDVLLF